jgi:hypothetical protein
VEQNKISHSGAAHGNNWCNADAGGDNNRLACARTEGEIYVGPTNIKAGDCLGTGHDLRKKAFCDNHRRFSSSTVWIAARLSSGTEAVSFSIGQVSSQPAFGKKDERRERVKNQD